MSYKVMVVDDSKVIHATIKNFLEGTDFEVIDSCFDGVSSVEHYETIKPDIVTMDIVMPGDIDGFGAAKKIIEAHPDAKILMVSSLVYDETINEAVKIGTKGFIFKPIDKDQLIATLTDIVKEKKK